MHKLVQINQLRFEGILITRLIQSKPIFTIPRNLVRYFHLTNQNLITKNS